MALNLAAYFANAYQLGYVCRDIEQGIAHFSDKLGVREFYRGSPDITCLFNGADRPFRIKVALATIGDRQLELIEPVEGVNDFYNEVLDRDGAEIALHHVGVFVPGSEDDWQALRQDVQAAGYDIEVEDKTGPGIKRSTHFVYIDTRELFGHRLEFLWRDADAEAWHATLPNELTD